VVSSDRNLAPERVGSDHSWQQSPVGHTRRVSLKDKVHRVDMETTSTHVVVTANGQVLADSTRPVVLRETGLPKRYYLPKDDVRMELLEPTSHHTTCPWKGQASYWSTNAGDSVLENVAWSYEDPIPDAEPIRGMVAFYPDRVEIDVG
jgi:uncharacterized protein (DUF427 family)